MKKDFKYIFVLSFIIIFVKPCCEELYWQINEIRGILFYTLYQITFYFIFNQNIIVISIIAIGTSILGYLTAYLK